MDNRRARCDSPCKDSDQNQYSGFVQTIGVCLCAVRDHWFAHFALSLLGREGSACCPWDPVHLVSLELDFPENVDELPDLFALGHL
jgi:hypothetical protein